MIKKLKRDLLEARLARDKFKTGVLNGLYSVAVAVGKDAGNRDTTDEEVQKVVKKFKKGVVETQRVIKGKAGMNDKKAELQAELDIYNAYLPKQMTALDMEERIHTRIQCGLTTMGDIMQSFKRDFPDQYDGRELNTAIQKILKGGC